MNLSGAHIGTTCVQCGLSNMTNFNTVNGLPVCEFCRQRLDSMFYKTSDLLLRIEHLEHRIRMLEKKGDT